jgi:hypothetical protein
MPTTEIDQILTDLLASAADTVPIYPTYFLPLDRCEIAMTVDDIRAALAADGWQEEDDHDD